MTTQTNRYRVAILYQTTAGRPAAAAYEVAAADEEAAIDAANEQLRADPKRKVGKIDGGDVVHLDPVAAPADTYTAEDMESVVVEIEDKIRYRVLEPMREALKAGRDALSEALTTHIYDTDSGEEPEPDCGYVATIAQMDAVLARTAGLDPAAGFDLTRRMRGR